MLRALVACCLLVLVAACSPDPPSQSSRQLAPAPVKKGDKDEAAVQRTLAGYNLVVKASLGARSKGVPAGRLRSLVSEPYATKVVKQLGTEHSEGLVMRGLDVYTTRTVRVHGDRATLVTCWDPRHAKLRNTHSESAVKPAPPTVTTFRLTRSGAGPGTGWKIAARVPGRHC